MTLFTADAAWMQRALIVSFDKCVWLKRFQRDVPRAPKTRSHSEWTCVGNEATRTESDSQHLNGRCQLS